MVKGTKGEGRTSTEIKLQLMIAMRHVDLISHTIPDELSLSADKLESTYDGEMHKKNYFYSAAWLQHHPQQPQTIISVKMLETKSLFN